MAVAGQYTWLIRDQRYTGLTLMAEWIFSGVPALPMIFQHHIARITSSDDVYWRAKCTISTASSKNVQGVSLSTASSMDVQGVYQPIACSVDVQGACISLLTLCRIVRHPVSPVPEWTKMPIPEPLHAWPKINLFLSISSLPFLFSELSPLSDTSSASASCFILLYYLISHCLGLSLSSLFRNIYLFPGFV
jgi:hypothetical protein